MGQKSSMGFLGKHHSEETKQKLRDMHKGKPRSKETTEKMRASLKEGYASGKIKIWNKGTKGVVKPNKTSFKKGHKAKHLVKGFKNKGTFKEGHKQVNTGRTHFKKGQNLGKNHPNWNGGSSFEPYGIKFDKQLKEQIRQRDNFICQGKECGKTQKQQLKKIKRKLAIHHIDYDKQNNNPKNLISLCHNCHSKTNFKREYWENYFKEKLKTNK